MVHTYHGAPICWDLTKQTINALSTCEAEHIAATSAAQQTTWIRRILQDIQMNTTSPTTFFIDNQSAILIAKNKGPTNRRKFIDLRHHYLIHQARTKTIHITHISSAKMLADILTKPLGHLQIRSLATRLHIIPHPPKTPTNADSASETGGM